MLGSCVRDREARADGQGAAYCGRGGRYKGDALRRYRDDDQAPRGWGMGSGSAELTQLAQV
jgi:hypothetical protein